MVTASFSDSGQHFERTRAIADLNAAYLELLSAQAATDKLCVNSSVHSILKNCETEKILRAVTVACTLCEFYARLGAYLSREFSSRGF